MKLLSKRIITATLVVTLALTPTVGLSAASENSGVLERDVSYTGLAVEQFSDTEAIKNGVAVGTDKILLNGKKPDEDFLFSVDDELKLSIDIPSDGEWQLAFEYKPQEDNLSDSLFTIGLNGEEYTGVLPMLRRDKEQQYSLDRNGDELSAGQTVVDEWVYCCFNEYTDLNKAPLKLSLKNGDTVTVKNTIQNIYIRSIYLVKKGDIPDYSEYAAAKEAKVASSEIIIEGERYAVTTSSSVRGTSENNPSLYPYETNCRRINTLSGSWSTSGQKAVWEFDVPEDGLYTVSFRYLQNASTNMTVYRDMEIDGKTLFSEMNAIAIPQTKSNTYSNFTFKTDNKPAQIYLNEGRHTISLTATMGPLADIYNEILELMTDVNDFGMRINKLASSSVDENRTWDTESYFPTAVSDLNGFADRAEELYEELEKLSDEEPVYANDLLYAADLLRDIADVPRTIPNKAEDISMGDSSVSKYLGTVISKMVSQSMSLDRIYISGSGDLPKASANFFVKLWEGLKQFIHSFTDVYEDDSDSDGQLKVWMSSSIPYVQTLQQLVDETYNAENGTDIEISVMTGEQKLILANAAGTNPDVVLGVGYGTPFNLAIRGAAKNLLEYDDFLEFYDSQYNLEALVPMCYGDGIYGATDSQDYQILYYRKDILNSLGLEVPETWNDVKTMMPLLLRYNMNFYLPLSASGAMKSMAVTAPLLYQNDAAYYSEDGLSVAFDSLNSVNAFTEMTELYSIYSLNKSVANFYNSFRYGEIPLGISGFSTYLQLELAAPELAGQWGTALVPGEVQEDGSVLRYQIADSTACMILENTKKSEEAWSFLKWWLSSDTQYSFATRLQSTLGSEYRWNTANLTAFEQLPYPQEHKTVIMKQWESQKELVPHAAAYMIQRETSNVWNNVVVNGKGLVESIDSAAILSNREIKRKMREFGFCDENGNSTGEYKAMTYLDLVRLLEERKSSK